MEWLSASVVRDGDAQTNTQIVRCVGPASSGSLQVPMAALGALAGPGTGVVDTYGYDNEISAVDGWQVSQRRGDR